MEKQTTSSSETLNFQCVKCGKRYLQYSSLRRHTREVHSSVRIKCDKCHYKTSRRDNLVRHYKIWHSGGRIGKLGRTMQGDALRVRMQEQGQSNRKSSAATFPFVTNRPGTSTDYQLDPQLLENRRETPGLQISEVLSLAPRVSLPVSSNSSAQSFPTTSITLSPISAPSQTSFMPTPIQSQVAAPQISPLTVPALSVSYPLPPPEVSKRTPGVNSEAVPSAPSKTSSVSTTSITASPVSSVSFRNTRISPVSVSSSRTGETVATQSASRGGIPVIRGSRETGQPQKESPSSTTRNTPTRPGGTSSNTPHVRMNTSAPRKPQTPTAPGQSGQTETRSVGSKYATVEETRIIKYFVDGRLVRQEEDTVHSFKQIPASWDNGKDIRDNSVL